MGWSLGLGPPSSGRDARYFFEDMKELSIFIDESGDFGEYSYHSPYYIIGMIFHDQSIDIYDSIATFEKELSNIENPNPYIHVGQIIRREELYKNMDVEDRIRILKRMMTFFRKAPIRQKAFYIEKKHMPSSAQAIKRLSFQISAFIKEYYSFFTAYDAIKLYYDNGQTEVKKMLSKAFKTELQNVSVIKIIPTNYLLAQAADLVCTLKLTALKLEKKALSSSEILVFDNERTLKKQYLKRLDEKEFSGSI